MAALSSEQFRNLTPLFQLGAPHATVKCCWCKQHLVSVLNGTIWRCPTPACFTRQLSCAVITWKRNQPTVHYLPLPIQTTFIECVFSQKWRRILFGGAAGVSKSHALRWLGHALCLMQPGAKVLLLRRSLPELEDSHLAPVKGEAADLGAHYTERLVTYANGSRFRFGHCYEKGDEEKYRSDEYDLILYDEETTFLESQIVLINSRARTKRKEWRPIVAGGTNPGGVSADYCRSHYVTKNPDPTKYPRYNPDEYHYIAGTLDDNPYINDDYLLSLDELPTELREAYRFGNWDIFPGQFFKNCRIRIHTVELDIPREVDRFCSLDWGYVDLGVCLWWAALPDGDLFVEDEFVFHETVAGEVAKEIARRTKKRGIRVRYTVADPSMWILSRQTGESIAETFRRAGWPLRKANNDRVNGWARLRQLIHVPTLEERYGRLLDDLPPNDRQQVKEQYGSQPFGKPRLRISRERCPYLCRTLPLLISDPNDPEDIRKHSDDHAADALRYGAMSRPAPTRFPDRPPREAVKGRAGELVYDVLDAMYQ